MAKSHPFRFHLPELFFGVVTALLMTWACFFAVGCQSAKAAEHKVKAGIKQVDGALDRVDGTATALDNGADPKAAADDLRDAVKDGKKASADVAKGADALAKDAADARDALANRGRLRLEWGLFLAGGACWALAGWQVWTLLGVLGLVAAAPGAALVAAGVSAISGKEPSVVRRAAFIASAFALGCALFWASASLDDIFLIGKWTAGVIVGLGILAAVFHFRKKAKKAKKVVETAVKVVQKVDEARKSSTGGENVVNFNDPATKAILDGMGADGKAFVNAVQGR